MRSPPHLVSDRVCSDCWRNFLITRNNSELSAFLVVIWCAYRNVSTFKFSAVIRTIVAEATMYFLAMVALQVYVQLSFALAV